MANMELSHFILIFSPFLSLSKHLNFNGTKYLIEFYKIFDRILHCKKKNGFRLLLKHFRTANHGQKYL